MVTHVLLAGVHQRLVIPALEFAQGQRLGDETAAPLAGEHLLMNGRDVPLGTRLGEKFGEQGLMLRGLAEIFQLLGIIANVEQQARVIFAVDEFPRATTDHHQGTDGAFGHVFTEDFIMPALPLQMRHQRTAIQRQARFQRATGQLHQGRQ
ncbi:hypothetical protein D3C78_1364500 [compost metagenome]